MARTADGASGSPVFGQTGQVTQDEPCSQKGKRIKSVDMDTGGQGAGIGIPAACGWHSGLDISTKIKDNYVKNATFEN